MPAGNRAEVTVQARGQSIGLDDLFLDSENVPMDAKTAARLFGDLFPAIYRRFHRRVGLADYRPTMQSLAVLEHLAATGPLTVGEMADHLDRSQAATSEIVERLVDREMLARMPDERDRRRVLVWLTPAGRTSLEEARRVLSDDLLLSAFGQLDAGERVRLTESMKRLLATEPRRKTDE